MLSYRHAFHAGNHADVLKHFVQVQLLRYLTQKDKAFWYIDTHAGAGAYELDSGFAAKNAEFSSGIARLWNADDLPEELSEYVNIIKALNNNSELTLYPGSPWLAQHCLREQDRARLFELHPSDFEILQENFAGQRSTVLQQADGFAGLKALLPPPPRRGLILIDPPYEEKQDYARVISALQEGLKRFATGTYAVWYPQLQRNESVQLPEQLRALPVNWLHVALSVQAPSDDGFGMHGSGMFIINPPWTLHATLEKVLPVLVEKLGQDNAASFLLEQQTR
jgi:23S rRNA (adenine2030-N6)-methyltransferase